MIGTSQLLLHSADSNSKFPAENVERLFGELAELDHRWENRLTINNLAFAKRYIESKLRLALYFRVSLLDSRLGADGKDYCAIFQGILPVGGVDEEGGELDRLVVPRDVHDYTRINASARGPYRYDRLVFVQDVKLVELKDRFIPSVVWLEPLDNVDSLLAGTSYLFQSVGFKRFGCVADGEIGGIWSAAVGDDHVGRDQIENSAEIMYDVADDSAEASGDFLADAEAEILISRFRVILGDDYIWVSVVKGVDFSLQVTDVGFGPFDL